MAASTIQHLVLKSRPTNEVSASNFAIENVPMPITLSPGFVLVRVIYLSIDPAIRMYISEKKTYWKQVGIGESPPTIGIGEVVKSTSEKYKEGEIVRGMFDCASFSLAPESDLFKIPRGIRHLPALLGPLGHHGVTAYVGLVNVGEVKTGETVLVSVAAGATGSIVVQVAKLLGCRVIGIVGSEAKRAWVARALQSDCVNYNSAEDLTTAIATICPTGIDVYWDNVGGRILDSALKLLNPGGRAILCGSISGYDRKEEEKVTCLDLVVRKGISLRGFIVRNYVKDYRKATQALMAWEKENKLVSKETILRGLERIPEGLQMLFNGKNIGKTIVQVGDLPPSPAKL